MDTTSENLSVADYYDNVLKNLNNESKLDLISKLSQSVKENKTENLNSLQSLFGAYQTEETAEQIIESIKSSRVFNRNNENL